MDRQLAECEIEVEWRLVQAAQLVKEGLPVNKDADRYDDTAPTTAMHIKSLEDSLHVLRLWCCVLIAFCVACCIVLYLVPQDIHSVPHMVRTVDGELVPVR